MVAISAIGVNQVIAMCRDRTPQVVYMHSDAPSQSERPIIYPPFSAAAAAYN